MAPDDRVTPPPVVNVFELAHQYLSERQRAEWSIVNRDPVAAKKNSTLYCLQLQAYWTEVHQIFTPCSHVITAIDACIPVVVFSTFRNDRANNKGAQFRRLQKASKIDWLP